MLAFQPNKTYATRSICDHEMWFRISVVNRTAKTVRVWRSGERSPRTCRISLYNGVEQVKPWGSYSMCPIIGADDMEAGA